MKVKRALAGAGQLLGAFAVLAMFWLYGLTIYLLQGLAFFRLAFYLPALGIVAYVYLSRRKHGFFLEMLAFILPITLAMVITLDLIPL